MSTKPKATVEQIKRYHYLLEWLAEQDRGRPAPMKCKRCEG